VKIVLYLLVVLSPFAADSSFAEVPKYGLEEFQYNELILLKIVGNKGGAAACFYATHDHSRGGQYVWISNHERVGARGGEIVSIHKKRGVRIAELQALNGYDWIEISFFWPLAKSKEADLLRSQCDSTPMRHRSD
jgi:hypothetical protein